MQISQILKTADSLKESYFHKSFEEGKIIFLNNTVKSGLIKFNGNLLFKESDESKSEKYKSKEVMGFVINRDTFITASVATYSMPNPNYAPSKSIQFLKQLIKGKACLYYMLVRTTSGFGSSSVSYLARIYYIRNSTSSEYPLVPSKKKAFVELLSTILSDDVNLISEIKKGDLKYSDITAVVQRFNQSTL
ncbi:MAG TPA: hypothetical protein VF691_00930 [Cytophagaceae bacterium]